MKYWIYIALLAFISCDSKEPKNNSTHTLNVGTQAKLADTSLNVGNEICWLGTFNNKTPVFLHYRLDKDIMIGEIVYLNTKGRVPITVIGEMDEGNICHLSEFEKSGNISGVITGEIAGSTFKGNWFSPKTKKQLVINLSKKDTLLQLPSAEVKLQDVFGNYHYQFTDEGYQGDFFIKKLDGNKAVFGITSVTNDPSRNIAQINDDTISLNATSFIYKVPGTDNCEFGVKFYKDFAYINYTKGVCEGQFGMNASIEGVYLKIR